MTPHLRAFQRDAKAAVRIAWDEFRRVLLRMPTGSGKTVTAASLIGDLLAENPFNRCLYLADQDELCFQPLAALDKFANVLAALEKGKHHAPLQARVVVGSVQTMARDGRLERFPPGHFTHVVVDECHRGIEAKRKVVDRFNGLTVGITATPFRSDVEDLSEEYDYEAYTLFIMDMIEEGFAPRMRVETLPVEIDLEGISTRKSDGCAEYTNEGLSTTIAPHYDRISQILAERASFRHSIVFLPLIDSSKAFATIARSHGLRAAHVDGSMSDRAEILERFRRGQINMLCNSQVIETGVDLPNADCIVPLRATKSAVKYQQMVGRGMRVLPGVIDGIEDAEERRFRIACSEKPECVVYDFLWLHDKLGVQKPSCVVATDYGEAEEVARRSQGEKTAEELEEIRLRILEEKEAGLVKRLEELAARAPGNQTDPRLFASMIGRGDIVRYHPVMRWEKEPATPAQLAKLGNWGLDIAAITSKGLASRLMDTMMHRFRSQMATVGQIRLLHRMKVPFNAKKISFKEAGDLISDVKMGRYRHHEQATQGTLF